MAESIDAPEADATANGTVTKAEWALAVSATALSAYFHALFFVRAGPLWRDEVNSVNIASLPTLAEVWKNLQWDSFPPGWLLTLRAWFLIAAPESDQGFRLLGLLTGLTIIALVWTAGRDMTGRPPVISLTLLLLNASVIRFCDSVRGYGLGLIGGVACIWALHRFATRGDRKSLIIGALTSVISVQFLYHNAVIVFATCVAAALVGLTRHSIRRSALALGIGAMAAISLIPSLPIIRGVVSWHDLLHFDIGAGWVLRMWQAAIETSGKGTLAVWYLILAAAAVVSVSTLIRTVRRQGRSDAELFHAIVLVVGTICYLAYIVLLDFLTAPWYFAGLLAIQAITADVLLARGSADRVRLLTVALLFAIVLVSFSATRAFVSTPATNMRLATEYLGSVATEDDLVVISPWEISISFERYGGETMNWQTLPPIGHVRWHRFDLVLEAIRTPAATFALIDEIISTLRNGHRVFIVMNAPWNPPEGAEMPAAKMPEQGRPAVALSTTLERVGYRFRRAVNLPSATEYETVDVLEIIPPDSVD